VGARGRKKDVCKSEHPPENRTVSAINPLLEKAFKESVIRLVMLSPCMSREIFSLDYCSLTRQTL